MSVRIYDDSWKRYTMTDAVCVLNQVGDNGQTLLFVVERNGAYYIEAGLRGSMRGTPAPLTRRSLALLGRMLVDEFEDDDEDEDDQ